MKRSLFIALAALVLLGGSLLRLAELHRYPPGLHYDEAADMLLSRDIAWHGYRPFPVVAAYSGREALFYYLAAPMLRIFGTEVMASRLTSALLGILAIAATIALGRALFRWHPQGALIALLAGAWLAVNGPQVWLTRQGFRTSPQPALEALCLWLLVVGLNRADGYSRLLPLILAGIFGGLALYVYMAARVFPLWLLLPLGVLLLADRARRGWRARQVLVFLGALALTAVPIVVFYAQNPEIFLDRLAQVAPGGGTVTLAESLVLHLKMFFIEGDPLLRYNLYPGRPFFDAFSGALLLIGLGAAAWLLAARSAAGLPPMARLAGAMLVFCPLLIAPSVIAVGGLPPSHMRSVAMVPLVFFLPALGAVSVVTHVKAQMHRLNRLWRAGRPKSGSAWGAVLALLFVVLGLNTWGDYRAWAARPDLFYDADGDLHLAAQWLAHNARPGEVAYIASRYYEHPTVLAHSFSNVRIRWMMDDHLFLPNTQTSALYIFPRSVNSARWRELLKEYAVSPDALPHGPDGAPAFFAYRITAGKGPVLLPTNALDTNVSSVLRLRGADLLLAQGGRGIDAMLYWELLRAPDRSDLAPILSIVDAWENEVGRAHPYFERTQDWQPGERLVQRVFLELPPGNPPGSYTLRVTWIGKARKNDYLPVVDNEGRFAGLWAPIGTFTAESAAAGSEALSVPQDASQVMPGLYALTTALPTQIEQGERLRFEVHWYAQQVPIGASLRFVAQRADSGEQFVLWAGQPVHDTYPFARWKRGEMVIDRYDMPTPPDLPPGDYRLELMLMDSPASTPSMASSIAFAVFTSHVQVSAAPRLFEVPHLANVSGCLFGDSIALVGWEAERIGADQARVRLAWQARATPNRDYTVTVQALRADGSLFSQQDRQPTRPTGRWIGGEYVLDEYVLDTPPDSFSLITALYIPENGLRLPIDARGGKCEAQNGAAVLGRFPSE